MSAAQCPRMRGGQGAVAAMAASLLTLAIVSCEEVGASASRARFSKSRSRSRRLSCWFNGQEGCSEPRIMSSSRKKGQGNICLSPPTLASPASQIVALAHRLAQTLGSSTLVMFRSGGFGLPCAAGALQPPSIRRALNSRRSSGASEVRRRPAAGVPFLGISSLDLAAPVPAGVALFSGQSYSRARLRLQAVGRRASVCVPASSSHLPHLTRSVASIFLKHGGLTECGQSRGVAAK
ncbi:hypothetical protein OFEAOIEE_LOCUS3040 [Methylorubrum extorquens]